MKTYTVIYNTETLKAVHYSFYAENRKEAIQKAGCLINGDIIRIVEVDNLGNFILPVTVSTYLAVGDRKMYHYGEKRSEYIMMNDNKPFQKEYANVREFLEDFRPTKPTAHLLDRIFQEFALGGNITFKPVGYKANMTFFFSHEN